jgi:hypothetical protein
VLLELHRALRPVISTLSTTIMAAEVWEALVQHIKLSCSGRALQDSSRMNVHGGFLLV